MPDFRTWQIAFSSSDAIADYRSHGLEYFVSKGRDKMSSLHWQLKLHWSVATNDTVTPVPLLRDCKVSLRWWLQEEIMSIWGSSPGAPLLPHFQECTPAGVSSHESNLNINVLEMKAVQLSQNAFLPQIMRRSLVLMNGNITVLAYLRKQGGTIFWDLQISSGRDRVV